ncbi:hypothetical protein ABNX05_11135 [Lysinibacillus sp. M3]|uniref:Replication protein n=1 Tax=Lysinibacillus zambalensis TaxID=3160866 RepID=A0ABV1MRN7_9BACI
MEKWIGIEDDTSGTYFKTSCPELSIRKGGRINAKKLYLFKSRFGDEYNITDESVITNIEKLLAEDDHPNLYEFLYSTVIDKFGAMEFVLNIGHKISYERNEGYLEGKKQMQKEMRSLLGIR